MDATVIPKTPQIESPATAVSEMENTPSGEDDDSDDEDDEPRTKCGTFVYELLTLLFPFRIFKHPDSTPWTRKQLDQSSGDRLLARQQEGVMRLFWNVIIVLFVVFASTQILVYVCFSFSNASQFPYYGPSKKHPTSGEDLDTMMLVVDFIVILSMYFLCFFGYKPNYKIIEQHYASHHEELNDIGVFHTLRKGVAWVKGEPFVHRWFTTFLADHILLFLVWMCYVTFQIVELANGSANPVAHALGIWKSVLKAGFLHNMLEYAPVVVRRRELIAKAVLLVVIALQLTEFFVLVEEKTEASAIMRTVGSGAQLFMTHSAIMLGAIMLGHHSHPLLCPDLTFKGLGKLAGVALIAIAYAAYAMGWERDHVHNQESWIAQSYAYVLLTLQIGGGFLVLLMLWFMHIRRHPHKRSFVTRSRSFAWGVAHHELDINPESRSPFDYDVSLVVISLVLSNFYFLSTINAAGVRGHWLTMSMLLLSVVAPIGLATFSVVLWRWPPNSKTKLRGGLMVALTLSCCLLLNAEAAEDCHLNAKFPSCCEYPALPDVNNYYEHTPDTPGCSGTYTETGDCVQLLEPSAADTEVLAGLLTFTYDYKYSRELIVQTVVYQNESGILTNPRVIWESTLTDIASPKVKMCAKKSFMAEDTLIEAGCSGTIFTNVTTADHLNGCEIAGTYSNCRIQVSARNCAYYESELLVITPLLEGLTGPLDHQIHQLTPAKDYSQFYVIFLLVGMAAAMEVFFTLFGLLLKIFILTESKHFPSIHRLNLSKAHGDHNGRRPSKRRTTIAENVRQSQTSAPANAASSAMIAAELIRARTGD